MAVLSTRVRLRRTPGRARWGCGPVPRGHSACRPQPSTAPVKPPDRHRTTPLQRARPAPTTTAAGPRDAHPRAHQAAAMERWTTDSAPTRLRSVPSWLISQNAVTAHRLVSDRLGGLGHHFRLLATLDEVGPTGQAALGRCSASHPRSRPSTSSPRKVSSTAPSTRPTADAASSPLRRTDTTPSHAGEHPRAHAGRAGRAPRAGGTRPARPVAHAGARPPLARPSGVLNGNVRSHSLRPTRLTDAAAWYRPPEAASPCHSPELLQPQPVTGGSG